MLGYMTDDVDDDDIDDDDTLGNGDDAYGYVIVEPTDATLEFGALVVAMVCAIMMPLLLVLLLA